MFAGQVKIVSHSSCRTSTVLKYFCPLVCCCRDWRYPVNLLMQWYWKEQSEYTKCMFLHLRNKQNNSAACPHKGCYECITIRGLEPLNGYYGKQWRPRWNAIQVCCVALPHDATSLSAVCDCDIFLIILTIFALFAKRKSIFRERYKILGIISLSPFNI